MKPRPLTRRTLLANAGASALTGIVSTPFARAAASSPAIRSINIMNFLRAEEPRQPTDLMEPVRHQMQLIKAHALPATWLLQYDALVEGPFVDFLKSEMLPTHEVGLWLEINRRLCDDAGIAWRGNPQWEWDYHVPVAYLIGYSPAERRKLADTAMATFHRIFGRGARSIASWNLDAITVAHLADHYPIDAFANCRDQLATDGFTIWGAPIAGYYPSRLNAWSPSISRKNQIGVPMLRLLGQDPVYYYDKHFSYPDTMEPAWPSGQNPHFVDTFLDMIASQPTQRFAYAQLGQENSFAWPPKMAPAYAMQMEKLAALRKQGSVTVETMAETGRRFKRAFASTPTQAQVMLHDPFALTPPQRTIWYQSKFYRANLHLVGNTFFLRDIHVYSDHFPQPYLTDPVREHGIEQRLPAVLDGYHWSDDAAQKGKPGLRAQGAFSMGYVSGESEDLTLSGEPIVTEAPGVLRVTLPVGSAGKLVVTFTEKQIAFRLIGAPWRSTFALNLQWVPERSAFQRCDESTLYFRFRDFEYTVGFSGASATQAPTGVNLNGGGTFTLQLA